MPVLHQKFQPVDVNREMKRIYFDVVSDKDGNMTLSMMMKNKQQYIADKESRENFIIKLKGSKNRVSSLTVENDLLEETFTVSTVVFHSQNTKKQEIFKIKQETVEATYTHEQMVQMLGMEDEDSLGLADMNLKTIADYFEQHMCIYKVPEDGRMTFIEYKLLSGLFDKDYGNAPKKSAK